MASPIVAALCGCKGTTPYPRFGPEDRYHRERTAYVVICIPRARRLAPNDKRAIDYTSPNSQLIVRCGRRYNSFLNVITFAASKFWDWGEPRGDPVVFAVQRSS
jgi:hypothetical protein